MRGKSRHPRMATAWTHCCAARSLRLTGILNGVDYEEWNPRSDRFLPQHFNAASSASRQELKQEFLQRTGLATRARSRAPAAWAWSAAWLRRRVSTCCSMAVLPQLLAQHDFFCAVLGSGDARYEEFFRELAHDNPTRVTFRQRLQRGARALDRGGERHVPDALAVRALRPEPDVQPALRHHSGRAAHRRTGGFGAALRSGDAHRHRRRVQ